MNSKIFVTLGPSSLSGPVVKKCTELGVHVFRINLSHTPLDQVAPTIEKIQSWTDVPVCLDTEGAQLRSGYMKTDPTIYKVGESVKIHTKVIIGDENNISFNPPKITEQLLIGDKIHVDFNQVEFCITESNGDYLMAEVISGGAVGSNKGADIDRDLDLDSITDKDMQAIQIGRESGITNFAMSFTNTAQNVRLMRELCGENVKIMCKIESPDGVQNLESILEECDEIIIDRGDLSRRVPIERIPFLQRMIITTARSKNVPVYVATNLLETMVTTPSPNRAEVNDVISTLEMGADGLILAAETAIGQFPVQAVQMIKLLIKEHERWILGPSVSELLRN